MSITAKQIGEFRAKTGLPMMECKKALEEANGDEAKALEILKKKGLTKALKKSDRDTKAGIVDCYIHSNSQIGVLVEVLSETDFVAKNEEFKNFVHDIALHIAASNPKYISKNDVLEEEISKERADLEAQVAGENKPKDIIEKIVNGRLEKFYEEICLLEQPFVKDQDKKVSDLLNEIISKIGENIVISKFSRFEIGR